MTNTKITDKIAKLLNLANDQQGTAEGDAALSRAMELMAQYGIDESDVSDHNTKNSTEMGATEIHFDNKTPYKKQQHNLVACIARALGCYTLGKRGGYNSQVSTVTIYGREIDRERVAMLYSIASVTMVDAAMKAVPAGSYDIKRKRLSHMIGYARAIEDSLNKHEADVRDDNGKGELVILNARDQAEAFARANLGADVSIRSGSGSRIHAGSYGAGYDAGSKFDTGSTGRISGKRALTA